MHFQQSRRWLDRVVPASLVLSVVLSGGCLSALAEGAAADGNASIMSGVSERESVPAANDYPVVNADKAEVTPKKAGLYQFRTGPILARNPLILIHGGEGETKPMFRWDKLVDRFTKEAGFETTFKTYMFRYDSKGPLTETVPQLKDTLKELYTKTGKQIRIVALSMGGNVIQGAMADPEISKIVDTVIALGSPFHGSPLFSQNWFQYSLDKSVIPFMRAFTDVDYKFYFSRHKNYQADLKWDNLDNQIPQVGNFKPLLPGGPKGLLTVESDSNPTLAKLNTSGEIDKSKFITYGGYIYNPYLMSGWHRKLENTILAPIYFLTVRLPMQIGKTRPALKVLNREMSRMVSQNDTRKVASHAYKLNDGITPMCSALFLPAQTLSTLPEIGEKDLPTLSKRTDVRTARAFKNIDHVAFLDGGPGKGKSTPVVDQMHKDEGSRPILDWIIYDLLKSNGQSQVAKSPAKAN